MRGFPVPIFPSSNSMIQGEAVTISPKPVIWLIFKFVLGKKSSIYLVTRCNLFVCGHFWQLRLYGNYMDFYRNYIEIYVIYLWWNIICIPVIRGLLFLQPPGERCGVHTVVEHTDSRWGLYLLLAQYSEEQDDHISKISNDRPARTYAYGSKPWYPKHAKITG